MQNGNKMRTYAFVLTVPDLDKSVSYFVDVLGFHPEWGDGTNWQALSRDDVRLMISYSPDAPPPAETGDHCYFGYLEVDDIDALHEEITGRGAIIRRSPADQPWGMREMAVATPDGHRIMIGQQI